LAGKLDPPALAARAPELERQEQPQRQLAERGAAIDRPDVDRRTPLFHAAAGGHLDTARFLLDRGADPNAADRFGDTPLMVACIRAQHAMAELLLARGADPTIRNPEGKTAADRAPDCGARPEGARPLSSSVDK